MEGRIWEGAGGEREREGLEETQTGLLCLGIFLGDARRS